MGSGILVAFEGIDGAGKSTQIREVAALFRAFGMGVVTSREPTDGPFGQAIRATAKTGRLPVEEELELFDRDRAQHVEEVIGPGLAEGALVLVDRYYFSTAAYQGIRGLDPDEIIRRSEARFPRPHLLVILELTPEQGLARVGTRGEGEDLFEAIDDLERCAAIFRSFRGPDVVHIDATQAAAAVTSDIVAALLHGPFQGRDDLEGLAGRVGLR